MIKYILLTLIVSLCTFTANAATVSLSWGEVTKFTDGSPVEGFDGYVIRYGKSTDAMTTEVKVNTAGHIVSGLDETIYYFTVYAVLTNGTESFPSNIDSTGMLRPMSPVLEVNLIPDSQINQQLLGN